MSRQALTRLLPPADAARPPRRDFLLFGSPLILDEDIEEVVATLRSGWIGTGPRVAAFERQFAAYVGAEHAIAVNSCTAALHLSLVAVNLRPGDEVIVPTMTFAATANAVVHAGGVPVLADVDRTTMCLEADEVEQRLSSRTRAILPVHFAGRACRMDDLSTVARAHHLSIVEDCAHAIETRRGDRHAGTMGDFGAFSFYVTKNLTTGDGGMVTTADPECAARIRALSLHGLSADAWERFSSTSCRRYDVIEAGFKYNMTDLDAALGIHQLGRLETCLQRRQAIWARYDEAFADLPVRRPACEEAGTRHARHLYTLLLDLERLTLGRDDIRAALHAERIGTGIHYEAVHLQPYYRQRFGYRRGDFPDAEWISDRTLSLPLSPRMTDEDVRDVIAAVRRTIERCAR